MNFKTTVSVYEIDDNGKVCVRTFKVKDDQTYINLMNELQFCRLLNEYYFYPDKAK